MLGVRTSNAVLLRRRPDLEPNRESLMTARTVLLDQVGFNDDSWAYTEPWACARHSSSPATPASAP